MESEYNFQIFIQSPELQIPSQSLLINPNQTLHHLKLSLFPKSTPSSQTLNSLFFTFNGKPLQDSTTLLASKVRSFSSLVLRIRALGGGGDGGSTCAESRDCYLNMYAVKKPDKVDPNETRLSKWTTCALSFEPLKAPCVIDKLGNVFNKEPLVEALLGKKLPKEFGYIKGLKDMISIQLEEIPGVLDEEVRFQCPISGLEFNGKYKFFALRSCGHVLSAKALKEVKSSACLVCHKEFSDSDKIVVNGDKEEVAALKEKMDAERVKLREKKMKKGGLGVVEDGSLENSRLSGSKHGVDEKVGEKGLLKVEGNGKVGNGGSLNGVQNASAKRLKAGVVAPANATKEVYASIFISSRKSEFKETYSCRSLPLGRN